MANGRGWTNFSYTPDGEHEYVSYDEYLEIMNEESEDEQNESINT